MEFWHSRTQASTGMQYGEDAIKEGMGQGGGGGGGGMADLFDMLGGQGRGRQQHGPKKGEDVVHKLTVSLKELYEGATRYGAPHFCLTWVLYCVGQRCPGLDSAGSGALV